MAKIISIANQKGGVGKTTTAVNFCASLKHRGRRVLLCDCDPQANATSGMGVSKAGHAGVYDIMVRSLPAAEAIVSTKFGDVLPSNGDLAGANVELVDVENREFMLKEALKPLDEQYDYIILDCPPSLELLTLNTLCASNTVLVPVQCEYYALEGLSDLTDTIRAVNRSFNHELE
ncbi:MAG: AAA family ATPase, partial [Oscillospiraceae bacterium]|nr:AAA family ATPase [Oscillospiraceae bacterium]